MLFFKNKPKKYWTCLSAWRLYSLLCRVTVSDLGCEKEAILSVYHLLNTTDVTHDLCNASLLSTKEKRWGGDQKRVSENELQ